MMLAAPAQALPQAGELGLTAGLAIPALVLGTRSTAAEPKWTHAPGIDTWFRERLKAETLGAQSAWATTSDLLVGGLIAGPLLSHLTEVTPLLIKSQAFLITGILTAGSKLLAGRVRPNPTRGNDSFFSGHTSFAFTGAALLLDQKTSVAVAGFAAATLVGALRIVADYHHFTDVLVGAAVGFGVGYLYPRVRNLDASREISLIPASPVGLSATYTLIF